MPEGVWGESAAAITLFGPSSSRHSLDDYVRRRHQHGHRGDDGEEGEGYEAEPVDDHRRELPVHDDLLLLVADLHAVGDELELFQDALELAVGRGRAVVRVGGGRGLGIGRSRGRRSRHLTRERATNCVKWPVQRKCVEWLCAPETHRRYVSALGQVVLQRIAVDPDESAGIVAGSAGRSAASSRNRHWPVCTKKGEREQM